MLHIYEDWKLHFYNGHIKERRNIQKKKKKKFILLRLFFSLFF